MRPWFWNEDMEISLHAAGLCPSGTLLVDAAPIKAPGVLYTNSTWWPVLCLFCLLVGMCVCFLKGWEFLFASVDWMEKRGLWNVPQTWCYSSRSSDTPDENTTALQVD